MWRFGGPRRGDANGRDDRHLAGHQIGGQRGEAIVVTPRKPKFDDDIAAFNETHFAQAETQR